MKKEQFKKAEEFMLSHKEPGVADTAHTYRVLSLALCIAEEEERVDMDVLTLACLLHDVGRAGITGEAGHAAVGAEIAYSFLTHEGWNEKKAEHVKNCIKTHSHKGLEEPESLEAQILYDADKLDMAGAIGCARLISISNKRIEPFYLVDEEGNPLPGEKEEEPSLFREVAKRKKRGVKFYTKEGKRLGEKRMEFMDEFFLKMQKEVKNSAKKSKKYLEKYLK